jgi:diguanylate cyclase (GGDEF)-like protein
MTMGQDRPFMNEITPLKPGPRTTADVSLRQALLDSRQRWRDLVMTVADIVFETDAAGRFIFLAPDPALGWPTATLIGQPAELLLACDAESNAFNPFRLAVPIKRRRAWLKRVDGSLVMLSCSGGPLLDADGRVVGARGLGMDWTEFDAEAGHNAAALRRGEVLDHILWRMGREVMAPRMMQAALDGLMNAVGAEGAAVIDLGGETDPALIHSAGRGADDIKIEAAALLATSSAVDATAKDGRPIIVANCRTRFGTNAGIALWRSPGVRQWDHEDCLLLRSAASLICMVLEHESIQQEMGRQARTDPLTGLLNRRAFLEEMERHIDRLDREQLPGTLMFADLDDFKPVNDRLGHEAGDEVLQRTATILRNAVRPSDVVARLGGDEFALWMNGADHLTAAERADHLCAAVPEILREFAGGGGPLPTVSIGIATREAGSGEPVDSLLRRADQAMYLVKRQGRGHWHVARAEGA